MILVRVCSFLLTPFKVLYVINPANIPPIINITKLHMDILLKLTFVAMVGLFLFIPALDSVLTLLPLFNAVFIISCKSTDVVALCSTFILLPYISLYFL